MYFFINDYNSIAYPQILDKLREKLDEKNPGYGFDEHTKKATDLIKKALGDDDCHIYFLPGGTSANIIGAACGMRQQDSIFSAKTGHIKGHEAGSIEATGIKIELIDSADGKLSRKSLEKAYKNFDTEYVTVPKKVYISNTTELGTVYKKDQIKEIYDFCKENDLYLFIDGARIAAGLPFGEALVVKNPDLNKNIINLIKQKGFLLAKGFVSGLIWEAVFEKEDFYLEGSKKAYKMAKILAHGLVKKGYKLAYPFESNQIFVRVDEKAYQKFAKIAEFEIMSEENSEKIIRLVTSFRTEKEEVEGFLSQI